MSQDTYHLLQDFVHLPQELLEPGQVETNVLLGFLRRGLFPCRKLLQPKLIVRSKVCRLPSHLWEQHRPFTVACQAAQEMVSTHQVFREGTDGDSRQALLSACSWPTKSEGRLWGMETACRRSSSPLWVILNMSSSCSSNFNIWTFIMSNVITKSHYTSTGTH